MARYEILTVERTENETILRLGTYDKLVDVKAHSRRRQSNLLLLSYSEVVLMKVHDEFVIVGSKV